MNVLEAIETRRSFRALEKIDISPEIIRDLARCASLAPSCNNKQPWRFVFVSEPGVLSRFGEALTKGNAWALAASMFLCVCTQKELDCVVSSREYAFFDTGMATAFLLLRAEELGLCAHPMAGFDEAKAKQILEIPEPMHLVTVIAFGKHSPDYEKMLTDWKLEAEKKRPERLSLSAFAFADKFGNPIPE